MVETVVEVGLPADETLRIQKNRICPKEGKANGKRISIVTGIHGDELEGQYVCYELAARIAEHLECLKGTVDIYPAMNPLGIDSVMRGIPAFDLDMNRIFPGRLDGDMNEYVAAEIIKDLEGSDLCLDIHASNIYLTEIPQIRINEMHEERLMPYAMLANVDFIWVHATSTVLESTLAYSLNSRNVPTLVVEMGVGMRITREYGDQLIEGIFRLMGELGIWEGPTPQAKPDSPDTRIPQAKLDSPDTRNLLTKPFPDGPTPQAKPDSPGGEASVRKPVISRDPEDVVFLNAPVSGIFIKELFHGANVKAGDVIGRIVDPLRGVKLCEVASPADGWLFTVREYPVVDAGSLVARILKRG